jgi:hypothetical protein
MRDLFSWLDPYTRPDYGAADYGVDRFRAWGVQNPERCCAVLNEGIMETAHVGMGYCTIDPRQSRQFCDDLLAAIDGRQKQKGRRR